LEAGLHDCPILAGLREIGSLPNYYGRSKIGEKEGLEKKFNLIIDKR
jgi:hypothetical protein